MSATRYRLQKTSSARSFKPDKWQEVTIKRCLKYAAQAVFNAPGMGKTVCMLIVFHILKLKKGSGINKLLVVSNRRIIHNVWPKEIKKWSLPYTYEILQGTKRAEAIKREADIYLINYENLAWLEKQPKRYRAQFDMLVLDESTKLKSWTSKRTYAMKHMLKNFKRRYILSGSPTPHSLLDIFAQIYMLDMGEALGAGITAFKNEYFVPAGYMGYGWEIAGEEEEQEIYRRIKHLVIRFDEKLLKLPPVIPIERGVKLSLDARKTYRDIEEDFITELESGTVTAANAGVASMKCRQIANGALYVEEIVDGRKVKGRKFETIHDEKIDELELLVQELNGMPLLVAYEFNHDRIRIQERMKKVPYIGSGVSDKKGKELEDQWNAGKLPVLLGHPDSVALGLNLQELPEAAICFFCTGWNLENHYQFIKRIQRKGFKGKRLYVYYIIAEDTIEEVVVDVQQSKAKRQEALLKAVQTHFRVEKKKRKKKRKKGELQHGELQPAILKKLQRKTGASINELAETFSKSESHIKVIISRLRKSGIEIERLGTGIYHSEKVD